MSAFSSSNFHADDYDKFRPTYGEEVFEEILKYHKGSHQLAVDIGCGSGQASYPLTKHFNKVIGTDLSHTMIKTANGLIKPELRNRIEFRQSPGESLSFLQDSSVDLVTAAQCIHWFDHDKFFQEIERVLKPGGTLAFWGYVDPIFNQADIDKFVEDFTYDDPTKLGPYWEQPGRSILRNMLRDVNAPSEAFDDIKVFEHRPNDSNEITSPLQVKRDIPLSFYKKYVTTWSSYHRWKEANPDKEDIADVFYKELQAKFKLKPESRVHIEWLTVLKLARRRIIKY